ncbi:MAG: hypothetical protein VKL60_18565 [Sphaerospermopsis sp.]|uniref:hypothetical protein n=1 Tax=Sphaerospermopsis sp. LEGE 08334 TaxID=1828651 RepID=UPI00187EDE60|nr:hypothetical protein [Sphaerospermopsis sp. LEGE 08334]MBE9059238.1 hypothetical protein [Sphaerospermopsis sp. LEGE 08334]MEB3151009.1 hypothetical protein [Sphaerospermopsis sp.]
MELSDEEKEIIRRYRQLTDAAKKAVLASENSFESWIKTAIAGVWKKILEVGSSEIITGIYHYLKKQLFGS